jgi:hypothetical protein
MKKERLMELAGVEKEENPKDVISVDVPLMIRLLEWAREDSKTDMQLHKATENLVKLSSEDKKILCMKDYDSILNGVMDNKVSGKDVVLQKKPAPGMSDTDYKQDNMTRVANTIQA